MRRARGTSRHMIQGDLTPLIDVVFLLIFFFMITSKFGDLRRTEIDLPREPGERGGTAREPAMIVDLTGDGRMLVDSHEVSVIELERMARTGLAAATDADPFDVLIRPDRNAPARDLDRVLSRLAAIGVREWRLGTVEPDGNGSRGGGS